jgi:hypothetical protein
MSQTGLGSAFVTSTDGTNNVVVWVAGGGGDRRLHGYNGDTGAVVYAGGGANEMMTGTRKWNTGIVARGRIYYPADNKIYAFNLPTGTPTPTPTPHCNGDTYSHCDRDTYSNAYTYTRADHPHCARLQSARTPDGGPLLEGSDFEQCRHLS